MAVAIAPAHAQDGPKPLSEKAVSTLLAYTWSKMPERCVTGPGNSIAFDKAGKSAAAFIPEEAAREAIAAGQRSAHANECGLDLEEKVNYCLYMAREAHAGKWSPPQMAFIGMLVFHTAHLLRGKVENVDGHVKVVPRPGNCSEAQRRGMVDRIRAFVQSTPKGVDCQRGLLYPYCEEAPSPAPSSQPPGPALRLQP
jgi:hypothetical protein